MEMKCGNNRGWFVDEINLTNVSWKSSNTNIATIDNNGKVTGIAEGDTIIIAQYNGVDCSYKVSVNQHSTTHEYFPILIFLLVLVVLVSISIIIYKLFKKKK